MADTLAATGATVRAWPVLLRAGVGRALTYRVQLGWWILSAIFPLIMMTVWLAVVDQTGPAAGFGRRDFIAYYVGAALVHQLTNAWLTWQWDEDFRTGALTFRMLRPVPPAAHYVAEDAGMRLVTAAALVPVVVALAVVLPDLDYGLTAARAALVVLAVLVGYALSCAMGLVFAMGCFWTTQTGNLYSLWWGAGAFVSGWIAPVEVLPAPLRAAAEVLPFRPVLGFPVELLVGRLDGAAVARGFAVGLAWTLVLSALAVRLWRHGVRRYQAVGG